MREIKFKGKVLFNGNHYFHGEWVKGFYYESSDKSYIVDSEEDQFGNCRGCHVEVERKSISQFTGVKNKNGKDIYENDILDDGSDSLLVFWDQELCSFLVKHISHDGFISGDDLWAYAKSREVVGNIHQDLIDKNQ